MSDIIVGPQKQNSLPLSLLHTAVAGLVTGLLAAVFAVSDAAFIFSGGLNRFLPVGIAIALASTGILAVITGLVSSMRGVIAVPQEVTVASLATIAAAVALAIPFSASEQEKLVTIICAIAIASTATGLFLFLLGRFRLGKLVRFVPVPVIAGFLAGIGCLIFFGSFGVSTGITPSVDAMHSLLSPHAIAKSFFAMAFAACVWFAADRTRSLVTVPVIIALATVMFHAFGQISGYSIADLSAKGWFPAIAGRDLSWPPLAMSDLAMADWSVIASQSFTITTMMLITAMAVSMNISGIETATGKDANIDTELAAAGAASLVAGASGGFAGFHGVSPSLVNLGLGGNHKYAGIAVAVVCIAVMLFGADLLALVPMPVFGGLLLWVALMLIKQWLVDTFRQLTGGEYAVIVLMALVLNALGFIEGLIAGLVAGLALFAIDYSRIDIVKTRLTGETFHSKRTLSEDWRALLREHGGSIVILRLQGFIFFGTAYQFVERIRKYAEDDTNKPLRFLVLDMRRTTGLDSSATSSLIKLEQLASALKFKLVLTDVPEQVSEVLKGAGIGASALTPVRQFNDLDLGLSWCEEKLVYRISPALAEASSVSVQDRFVDGLFDENAAQIMLKYMNKLDLEQGEVLIKQDSESQDMYFIESGRMAIYIGKGDTQSLRVNSAEPGSFVGEISFYLGHQRTASVICEKPARVWQFSHDSLE
ncbi:MAG: SulP family inorganic anion transporter, partial [Aestuariivirgaceae bacterium]